MAKTVLYKDILKMFQKIQKEHGEKKKTLKDADHIFDDFSEATLFAAAVRVYINEPITTLPTKMVKATFKLSQDWRVTVVYLPSRTSKMGKTIAHSIDISMKATPKAQKEAMKKYTEILARWKNR